MLAEPRDYSGATIIRPNVYVIPWRIGAALIDVFILGLLWQLEIQPLLPVSLGASATGSAIQLWIAQTGLPTIPWEIAGIVAYFIVFECLFGRTPGKAMMHLRVIDIHAERPTVERIVVRNIVRPIEALPQTFFIGGIAWSFSPLRQRIGDRLAGTMVVASNSVPDAAPPVSEARRRGLAVVGMLALIYVAGQLVSVWNPLGPSISVGSQPQSSLGITGFGPPAQRIIDISVQRVTHPYIDRQNYHIVYDVLSLGKRLHCTTDLEMQWLHPPFSGWRFGSESSVCAPSRQRRTHA